jgi:ADP-ribose pyrophosphatase YjhB (NUDIX family)
MTLEEKKKILTMSFNDLWTDLWGNFVRMQYQQEEKMSKQKFLQIREGIYMFEKDFYNIESLINNSKTKWITPEWGFPKGRRNYMETDNSCAIREFNEETGYTENDYEVIKNVLPYEEIFMGSNYKSYKHKYYLAIYRGNKEDKGKYQKTEVSNMKWLTL